MGNGLIFDIKKYAINDGPGIRMTVFFKGCNLACQWCHNPESMSPKIQKMYNATKCIAAVACIEVCPNDALVLTKDGIITDTNACDLCGKCAEVCPTKAFEMLGESISLDTLMNEIENESIFFDQSGGGVTFSGGEPLMHYEYLLAALKACGKRSIHRVIDTTLFAKREIVESIAAHTDLFLVDLKMMNTMRHKEFTGVKNEKILDNIRFLAKNKAQMIFRMPLIARVNATSDNIEQTITFIKELGLSTPKINLLPYHAIAENKLVKLGEYDRFKMFDPPTDEEIEGIIAAFQKQGIEAIIGG